LIRLITTCDLHREAPLTKFYPSVGQFNEWLFAIGGFDINLKVNNVCNRRNGNISALVDFSPLSERAMYA